MSPIMADLLRWRRLDTMGKSLVVGLAQLVERQIVVLEVVGSNPTSHPTSSRLLLTVNA